MPVQKSAKRSATRCLMHDRACPLGGATQREWLAWCERISALAATIIPSARPAAEVAVDLRRQCRAATEQDRMAKLGIFADPNPHWVDPAVLELAEEIRARPVVAEEAPVHQHGTVTTTALGVRSYADGCPVPEAPRSKEAGKASQRLGNGAVGDVPDADGAEPDKRRRRRNRKPTLTIVRY